MAADDKVYFVSETGEAVVLSTAGPRIVARNDIGERALASPAIAGGRIFIRTDGHVFAIEQARSQSSRPGASMWPGVNDCSRLATKSDSSSMLALTGLA